ncbi:INO80 complex subunit E [Araneus ventricosus]|uniref:INO80 complex subunit E n=1 Tax=Araneus ventricosus TaxID=182803 RepID=A0A4Y2NEH1_ARAVE|nr:INO80 complex subunit E [Araneus ventricosus]GBN36980.1 INO80 complex subunit E [Araneus ventricosus]GBN42401.1 INO80 complex subunit E [Araneus ventricosus]GBN42565.1 INO80 complex subunit E [Araneus ventricosus]
MRMPSSEPDSQNYHQKYLNLKRKLKFLLYENESFQEELKKAQRKLLKVSRDKSFLLDRLLRYETVESSSSDSEATVSSDSDSEFRAELLNLKKKKTSVNTDNQDTNVASSSTNNATNEVKKKKNRKACPAKPVVNPVEASKTTPNVKIESVSVNHGDGHMTSEEIERHLEAKQSLRDLIPEKTPLTVPAEMFSNEPSVMECEIMDGQVSDISSNTVVENVGIMIDIQE